MSPTFHRKLAIPVWGLAAFAATLAAAQPGAVLLMPATLFVISIVGIGMLIFAAPGAFPWLRPSPLLVRVGGSNQLNGAGADSARGPHAGVALLDGPPDMGRFTPHPNRALTHGNSSATAVDRGNQRTVPGLLGRLTTGSGDILAAVAVVLCIPFVILAIGIPFALSVRLLLWITGLL